MSEDTCGVAMQETKVGCHGASGGEGHKMVCVISHTIHVDGTSLWSEGVNVIT